MLLDQKELEGAATILRSALKAEDGAPSLAGIQSVADRWPGIVGHEFQRLLDELEVGNVAGTAWQLCDCAEVLCKFSAAVMVMDLRAHAPEAADPFLDRLFQRRMLSFGTWVDLTVDLAKGAMRLGTTCLLAPEVAPLFVKAPSVTGGRLRETSLTGWVRDTVTFRNNTRGHGAYGADLVSDAQALVTRIQDFNEALLTLPAIWPADLRMYADTTPPTELMGAPSIRSWHDGNDPETHREERIPLELMRGDQSLHLSPLVTLRRCLQCGKQDGFLFDSGDPGSGPPNFYLLDYFTGHRRTLPHFADESLTGLATRPVVEALGTASDPTVANEFSETDLKNLLLATDVESRLIVPTYLIEPVCAFLDEKDRGVLLVEGPGHMGKSVAMLALEERLRKLRNVAVVRFAVKKEIAYTPLQLDLAITDTLRKRFGREEKDQEAILSLSNALTVRGARRPDDVFVDFLRQIMEGPMKPAHIDQVVLIIDGLDEIRTPRDSVGIHELLPRPADLPEGCFLILTSRPLDGQDVPSPVRRRIEAIGLAAAESERHRRFRVAPNGADLLSQSYQALLRAYFDAHTKQLDFPDQAHQDALFSVLLEKSRELFGYLAHLVSLLEDQVLTIEQVEALPEAEGLYDVYLDYLERRLGGGSSGKVWAGVKRILLVLVADEQAFAKESEAWDEWLPAREYRGVPLEILARLMGLPGVTYSLVWALYAFKHLLASWRGSDTELTHWRLGLKGLRQTIERRWPEELKTTHRQAVSGLAEAYGKHWDELPADDPFIEYAALRLVWHAASVDRGDMAEFPNVHAFLDALDRWDDPESGNVDAGVRICLSRLQVANLPGSVRNEDDTAARALAVTTALSQLGNRLVGKGLPSRALKAHDRAVQMLQSLCKTLGDACPTHWRIALARAYSSRGAAKQAAPGHGAGAALPDYEAAIRTLDALGETLADACPPAWRNALAGAYMDRGAAKQDAPGHGAVAALADYDAAIRIREALVVTLADDCPPDWRDGLARIYGNRGNAKQDAPGHGAMSALADYDAAIRIHTDLVETLADACRPEWRSALACSYTNRGNAKQAAPGYSAVSALADYDTAIRIHTDLVEMLGDACPPNWRSALAGAFMNRGNAKQAAPGHGAGAALPDYDAAVRILEALVETLADDCPPAWRNKLAAAYVNRGAAKRDAPGHGAMSALADYDAAIRIHTDLVETLADDCPPDWRSALAGAYMNRGNAKQAAPGYGAVSALADYDTAIRIYTDLVETQGDVCPPDWRNKLAAAYVNRGAVKRAAPGHGAGAALADYDAAIRIRTDLVETLADACPPAWRNDLAGAYVNRGYAKQDAPGHGAMSALADYDVAIRIREALVVTLADDCPPDWRNDLAGAYVNRGNAKQDAPGYGAMSALADYDAAIRIREALVVTLADDCPPAWRNDLARAYVNRGAAKRAAPGHGAGAALADCDAAIRIREALVVTLADDCPPDWRNDLAGAYVNRGAAKQGAPGHGAVSALADYDVAIRILEALVETQVDACPPAWRNDLARAYVNRGNAKQAAPGHGAMSALADYDVAIRIREALVVTLADDCPPDWRNDLAGAYVNRGNAKQDAPGHGAVSALADYDAAVGILEALVETLADDCPPAWRNKLAAAYVNRGAAKQAAPGHGAVSALADCDTAIRIQTGLVETLADACPPDWRIDLARAHMIRGLAKVAAPGGEAVSALADYDAAIRILDALVETLADACPPALRNELAGAYMDRGAAKQRAPGHGAGAALADYDAVIRIREGLVEALGNACPPDWRFALAVAYLTRGNAKKAAPGHGAVSALADYDAAIRIREALVETLADACPPDWRNDLAGAYVNRGYAKQDTPGHGVGAALADYDIAIRIREELVTALGDRFPRAWATRLANLYRARAAVLDACERPKDAVQDRARADDLDPPQAA